MKNHLLTLHHQSLVHYQGLYPQALTHLQDLVHPQTQLFFLLLYQAPGLHRRDLTHPQVRHQNQNHLRVPLRLLLLHHLHALCEVPNQRVPPPLFRVLHLLKEVHLPHQFLPKGFVLPAHHHHPKHSLLRLILHLLNVQEAPHRHRGLLVHRDHPNHLMFQDRHRDHAPILQTPHHLRYPLFQLERFVLYPK